MKKIDILKSAFFLLASLSPAWLKAQDDMGHYSGNYYLDYVGERISVVEPASLSKSLPYTISHDGSTSTNEWGSPVNAPLLNLEVVKASPYLGCGSLPNMAGKIALILRGDCEFSTKAKNAQAAGAAMAIIVNHTLGGPVGMGAGAEGKNVNIPVIMISKEDGDALAAAIDGGQTVKMSISNWSNNLTHDLAIVKSGVSMWHNYSTPGIQLENGGADAAPYKGINGAVIANFGSSDETNVKLKTTLTFTPTGGTATEVRKDSVTRPTFAVGDSIISPFVNEYYSLMSSRTPGRYDLKYEVTSDNADDFASDNVATHSFYVDNRIFSKSRYDFANFRPISNIGYSYSNGSEFMWGPIYHVTKGNYKVEMVQFAVSKSQQTDISNMGTMNIIIWKWADGSNGQPADKIMQSGETTPVGIATKKFVAGDTSGQFFTVSVTDAYDPGKILVAEDNTTYWVTAVVPSNTFLACDGQLNYQVRTFDRFKSDGYTELYAPMYQGVNDAYTASAGNISQSYPFESSTDADSARFAQQKKGTVPSISMIMGLFPISVKDVNKQSNNLQMNLFPNPANDNINLSVKLDNAAEVFNYTIVSADGKVSISDNYRDIKEHEFKISVKNLPAGNYYLIATADDKAMTRPFVIVR